MVLDETECGAAGEAGDQAGADRAVSGVIVRAIVGGGPVGRIGGIGRITKSN